jgi:hypothetical protein
MCGTNISIPNTFTTIGDHIADNCSQVKGTLTIPNTITTYSGTNNFSNTGLDTVINASSAPFVSGLFENLPSLMSLTLTSSTLVQYYDGALNNTPLIDGEGAVYVPSGLLDSYVAN